MLSFQKWETSPILYCRAQACCHVRSLASHLTQKRKREKTKARGCTARTEYTYTIPVSLSPIACCTGAAARKDRGRLAGWLAGRTDWTTVGVRTRRWAGAPDLTIFLVWYGPGAEPRSRGAGGIFLWRGGGGGSAPRRGLTSPRIRVRAEAKTSDGSPHSASLLAIDLHPREREREHVSPTPLLCGTVRCITYIPILSPVIQTKMSPMSGSLMGCLVP
jgi:hypothetical protein